MWSAEIICCSWERPRDSWVIPEQKTSDKTRLATWKMIWLFLDHGWSIYTVTLPSLYKSNSFSNNLFTRFLELCFFTHISIWHVHVVRKLELLGRKMKSGFFLPCSPGWSFNMYFTLHHYKGHVESARLWDVDIHASCQQQYLNRKLGRFSPLGKIRLCLCHKRLEISLISFLVQTSGDQLLLWSKLHCPGRGEFFSAGGICVCFRHLGYFL